MYKREIFDKIEAIDGAEMTVHGERESAGQVFYEIGVAAEDADSVGDELREFVGDSDWVVTVYEEGGRPWYYDRDADEDVPSDIRVKKNLYNEHMI